MVLPTVWWQEGHNPPGSDFSPWNGDLLPGGSVGSEDRALHPLFLASLESAWDKPKAYLICQGFEYSRCICFFHLYT